MPARCDVIRAMRRVGIQADFHSARARARALFPRAIIGARVAPERAFILISANADLREVAQRGVKSR